MKKARIKLSNGKEIAIPQEIFDYYHKEIELAQKNPERFKIVDIPDLEGNHVAVIKEWTENEERKEWTLKKVFLMLPDRRKWKPSEEKFTCYGDLDR